MGIRTLDLFSGGGGSSYGARAAGAEIVCGVDAWPCATAAYAANFGEDKAVNLTLDAKSSPSALGNIGSIDLLLASPECTSHTCARGGRPPDEESKGTANYVLAFAAKLKPRWVVVENVIHMRGWQGYKPLIEALRKQGYRVRIEVLDASRFGVPQSRQRLFILADRERKPRHVPRKRGRAPSARRILDPDGCWPPGRCEASNVRNRRSSGPSAQLQRWAPGNHF